jgi:hypothetical protein
MAAEATFKVACLFWFGSLLRKTVWSRTGKPSIGVVIRPCYLWFQCRSIKERSSVEEVYALVVSGLTKAYSDLPKIVFMPILRCCTFSESLFATRKLYSSQSGSNDVMKIVVTAYLINMQMPLTMILTNRKTYLLFKLRNKPGTIKLPIIMLRKTMEVAVVISKSEITILINSQTQMMRDVILIISTQQIIEY